MVVHQNIAVAPAFVLFPAKARNLAGSHCHKQRYGIHRSDIVVVYLAGYSWKRPAGDRPVDNNAGRSAGKTGVPEMEPHPENARAPGRALPSPLEFWHAGKDSRRERKKHRAYTWQGLWQPNIQTRYTRG